MMRRFDKSRLSAKDLHELCLRNPVSDETRLSVAREIYEAVRTDGDAALIRLTERFDQVRLKRLEVAESEFARAIDRLPESVHQALEHAARNIELFHSAQRLSSRSILVEDGVECWRETRPIRSVGLYVPGGTAVLPSTALMLGIPARLAGCEEVVLCVPPNGEGDVPDAVLVAAQLAGVRKVFKIGGAQAIAAMALGTESLPKVEKIFGPGNQWVQAAKALATFEGVQIDMIAGPSEVLVVADEAAQPTWVAADLISQAEHGSDSLAILVTPSNLLSDQVLSALEHQLRDLPRASIARKALDRSFVLMTRDLEDAFDFSNMFAPEHLILHLRRARSWVDSVRAAGSVFVGPCSPETAGDYASGTNHTLPTSGMAGSVSGVSLDSFMTTISFQELTAAGLLQLSPTLTTLARLEGLEGHARAVEARTGGRSS